jgi:hypothetical protein
MAAKEGDCEDVLSPPQAATRPATAQARARVCFFMLDSRK